MFWRSQYLTTKLHKGELNQSLGEWVQILNDNNDAKKWYSITWTFCRLGAESRRLRTFKNGDSEHFYVFLYHYLQQWAACSCIRSSNLPKGACQIKHLCISPWQGQKSVQRPRFFITADMKVKQKLQLRSLLILYRITCIVLLRLKNKTKNQPLSWLLERWNLIFPHTVKKVDFMFNIFKIWSNSNWIM